MDVKAMTAASVATLTALRGRSPVRPYCANDHYWQVYFDSNRLIRDTFGEAGYPSPMAAYSANGLPALPPDVFSR
jgi:hypothetical protein